MSCRSEVPTGDDWLAPSEVVAQRRYAVPSRRADWRLGRWTAKQAVSAWCDGHDPPAPDATRVSIDARSADDGFPVVRLLGRSDAPAVSISHRGGRAVCAVGPGGAAVGCDLEHVEPRSAAFPEDWFTPAEQEVVAAAVGEARPLLVTLIWSAKESVLKAVGLGLRADTRTVHVGVGSGIANAASPTEWGGVAVRPDTWSPLLAGFGEAPFAGWWRVDGGDVVVVMAAGDTLRDEQPIALRAGETARGEGEPCE